VTDNLPKAALDPVDNTVIDVGTDLNTANVAVGMNGQ
jgi:hypothetical protein